MRYRNFSFTLSLCALQLVIICTLCLGGMADMQNAGAAEKPEASTSAYKNSLGMEFVLIQAGSFNMGADARLEDTQIDEAPIHRVIISKAFFIGKYEVTRRQWAELMEENESPAQAHESPEQTQELFGDHPVTQISWDEAQSFIERLNLKEGGNKYRLPTEAEWEYAARAGSNSTFYFGDDAAQLGQYAWFGETIAQGSTHPVGQKQPNAWGLYDIHGNVWEMVQDWYGMEYYNETIAPERLLQPSIDPAGPESGISRVERGGSWNASATNCRTANRHFNTPDKKYSNLGFRLAMSLE
jgi:formylglycine-generating enzyme required for sulfatase activity